MIFLSFSLLSARLFSRGDESYERVVAWRMGKKKKEKKRRRWKATREILGTIFGANGYKRGDWPRPIHHRVPPQLFPLRSPLFLLHPFASLLPSSSLSPPRWKEGRVARNKTHPSPDPRALSAVDKQASNNVMNSFPSPPPPPFFDLPFPRWPCAAAAKQLWSPAAGTRFIAF